MKYLFLFPLLLVVSCFNVDNYDLGVKSFREGDYNEARFQFKFVKSDHPKYDSIAIYTTWLDSITELEKVAEQIVLREEQKKQREKLIDEGSSVLDLIKTYSSSSIPSDLIMIMTEIELYSRWGKSSEKFSNIQNDTIQKIGSDIRAALAKLQKNRLPKLRKAYGEALNNKLWEDDIEVRPGNAGYRTLNLYGGIFTANRNIKDFQAQLQEQLQKLRFSQTRYRWYDGADEFTYYDLTPPKDSELY